MSINVYDPNGNFVAGSYMDGMWSGPQGTDPGTEKPRFFDTNIPQPTAPTRIRQGDGIQDYSNYGWSQNLQDFFNQQQPEDSGSWSYDIANKTFGMGGGRPGPGNQQSWYSDIPQDVMNQYVDSQKAQNNAYQNYFTNNPTPLQNENGSTNFGDWKPPEITDISKYFHQTGGIQTPTQDKGLPNTDGVSPPQVIGDPSTTGTEPSPQTNGNYTDTIEQPSGLSTTLLPTTPSNTPTTAPTVAPAVTSPLPSSPTTTGIGGLPTPDLTQPSTGQTTTQPANTVSGMDFNPATNSYNPTPTASTTPTNTGALAGIASVGAAATQGNAMSNLLQGAPLPDVKTTQTSATTAPDWYNSFLSGLSTAGQAAVNTGGVAGASPLQQQAYDTAGTAIAAGQPALNEATNVATGAAAGPDIGQFMNPYTTGVVNEIGRLGQKNFNDILAPNAVAGAAGSGQFGSRRGMQVYGDVARDVSKNITGQQTGALQAGYKDAVTAALQEQQNRTLAANTLGTLSGQAYTQGTGGLNVLSGLGAQQQATQQAAMNYPMTAQQNLANIMRGFTVPTTQTQTYTGPMPGAYSNSPLAQISALTAGTAGIFANKVDPRTGQQIPGTSVYDTIKGIFPSLAGLSMPNVLGNGNSGGTTTPDNTNYTSGSSNGGAPMTFDPNSGTWLYTDSGMPVPSNDIPAQPVNIPTDPNDLANIDWSV
jgi:hypothetical protein